MSKQDFPPLLPAGLHPMDIESLRTLCVDGFTTESSRGRLMHNLELVLSQATACGISMEAWIDGSFLTEKINPQDVDLVFRIARSDWSSASAVSKANFTTLLNSNLKELYSCDCYFFPDESTGPAHDDSEWTRAYWIRQFGFSRSQEPKGMAVINIPYVSLT